jgi:hypothetical protein
VQLYSSKQSLTTEGRHRENRGGVRLVTSIEGSRTLERRLRHGGVSGQRWQSYSGTEKGPVSMDLEN